MTSMNILRILQCKPSDA